MKKKLFCLPLMWELQDYWLLPWQVINTDHRWDSRLLASPMAGNKRWSHVGLKTIGFSHGR